jgi:hypothetical protein
LEIGVLGFSTIFVMLPSLSVTDHAEALVVLDLLHPDDPVGVGRLDHRQIRLEDRVDEDDQHVLIDVRLRELHRAGGPVLHRLLDEGGGELELRLRVVLHLLLQVARHVDDLLDAAEPLEILEDVRHHRLAGDLEHRLRTRCVCGRSRVPFPASGMMTFMVRSFPRVRSGP